MASPSPNFPGSELSDDCDMLEHGSPEVEGLMRPEDWPDNDFTSPYSDFPWGGENVPVAMSCPVVELIPGLEDDNMLESLQTEADI